MKRPVRWTLWGVSRDRHSTAATRNRGGAHTPERMVPGESSGANDHRSRARKRRPDGGRRIQI